MKKHINDCMKSKVITLQHEDETAMIDYITGRDPLYTTNLVVLCPWYFNDGATRTVHAFYKYDREITDVPEKKYLYTLNAPLAKATNNKPLNGIFFSLDECIKIVNKEDDRVMFIVTDNSDEKEKEFQQDYQNELKDHPLTISKYTDDQHTLPWIDLKLFIPNGIEGAN
jgi:hypothetical protein